MRISDWSSDVCSSDLDQLVHARLVAQVGDGGQHLDLDPAEEHRGLLADGDHVDLDALLLPAADLAEQLAEQVVVQPAGQAAVGRDDDEIGRAHVCTQATHAHLVCRLLLETKTYTN